MLPPYPRSIEKFWRNFGSRTIFKTLFIAFFQETQYFALFGIGAKVVKICELQNKNVIFAKTILFGYFYRINNPKQLFERTGAKHCNAGFFEVRNAFENGCNRQMPA